MVFSNDSSFDWCLSKTSTKDTDKSNLNHSEGFCFTFVCYVTQEKKI